MHSSSLTRRHSSCPLLHRSLQCVSSGFLSAPHGQACVGFMYAAGLPTLMAWNANATEQALRLYNSIAQVSTAWHMAVS